MLGKERDRQIIKSNSILEFSNVWGFKITEMNKRKQYVTKKN